MTQIRRNGHVLQIEREVIDVTSNSPRADQAWTFTDTQGHEHYWRDGWPTLTWVADVSYWCEDCNDTHDEGHWECPLCGEHVEPGMRSAPAHREFIPGPTSYYLDGEPITKEEADRFRAEQQGTRG